jgi:hypothetical protein
MNNKVTIFLGGTIPGPDWRSNLINKLNKEKFEIFNPKFKNYDALAMKKVDDMKVKADYKVFMINPYHEGFYTYSEIMEEAINNPHRTKVIFLSSYNGISFKRSKYTEIKNFLKDVEKYLEKDSVFYTEDDFIETFNAGIKEPEGKKESFLLNYVLYRKQEMKLEETGEIQEIDFVLATENHIINSKEVLKNILMQIFDKCEKLRVQNLVFLYTDQIPFDQQVENKNKEWNIRRNKIIQDAVDGYKKTRDKLNKNSEAIKENNKAKEEIN